jgi:hypothetical protein
MPILAIICKTAAVLADSCYLKNFEDEVNFEKPCHAEACCSPKHLAIDFALDEQPGLLNF